MCRTFSDNDVEQLAHEAFVDASAPLRTLIQDLSLTGLVDTTAEVTPDVINTNVYEHCPYAQLRG